MDFSPTRGIQPLNSAKFAKSHRVRKVGAFRFFGNIFLSSLDSAEPSGGIGRGRIHLLKESGQDLVPCWTKVIQKTIANDLGSFIVSYLYCMVARRDLAFLTWFRKRTGLQPSPRLVIRTRPVHLADNSGVFQ